ncbi:MAG: hypothetical protein F4204_15455 [Rhodospirillaceae bacterium]|nr:hypothetical protein [Rhodospirillaceae bacterium]
MTRATAVLAATVLLASPAGAHFPDRCSPQRDAWATASSVHNGRLAETRRLVGAGANRRLLAAAQKRQTETAHQLSIALRDLFLCIEGVEDGENGR